MIWMSWRQFRTQAVIGLAALVTLSAYLVVLGRQIHHAYSDALAHCAGRDTCASTLGAFTDRYGTTADLLAYLLLAIPGFVGAFWGGPLIARELEAGTHRLAWNQSVTRTRWLLWKITVAGLAAVGFVGVISLLLTWSTGPLAAVLNNRFEPVQFASHGITPLGYAVFAFVLGTFLGLAIRRTVPAIATTLVLFAVVQGVVPALVRPHFAAPVRTSVPLSADLISRLTKIGTYGDIGGLRMPGGPWVVETSAMLGADGKDVGHGVWFQDCMDNASLAELPTCLAKGNVHVDISEQPASRYWRFQVTEATSFATLSAALAGLCFWRIRRR